MKENDRMEVWSISKASEGNVVRSVGEFDMNAHPAWRQYRDSWERKEEFNYYRLAGSEKDEYIKIINATPHYLAEPIRDFPDTTFQGYYFNEGGIFAFTLEPQSEEHKLIMKRFTSVFSLTFRRYQDLKKAEEQAREARIEAALERVRSRSLAMHKSDELKEVIQLVFEQLVLLDFVIDSASFILDYKASDDFNLWTAVPGRPYPVLMNVPYFDHVVFNRVKEAKERNEGFFTDALSYEEKNQFFNYFFHHTAEVAKERQEYVLNSPGWFRSQVLMNSISLFILNYKGSPYSEGENEILKRFGRVFEQAYIRFLDLQKAEAQAREATIEAALERVRAKAMAMHSSADLSATASLVFVSLRSLGINPLRSGIGIVNKERVGTLYASTPSDDGETLNAIGSIKLTGHHVLEGVYEYWEKGEAYLPVLNGEALRTYYKLLLSSVPTLHVPEFSDQEIHYGHFIPYSAGVLYAWSDKPYDAGEINVLKRFSAVIDLTYRRYVELQQAEATARDAVRQASLDRVRAEIASMRTVRDLDRITPIIWNELTALGIPFVRCGVFIMDESQKIIHTFLSTPDGRAIAAFQLPFDIPGRIGDIQRKWQCQENYIAHWDVAAFEELAKLMLTRSTEFSKEKYMSTVPTDGINLHCLHFLQGMLYVGNITVLNDDDIQIIQLLADAFSTAYARYEDFTKLEMAKQQVDTALKDLRSTQTQLVQSEKMASLGELTAGIAHEIQNPLNFVNNFSEVSKELLDEMKTELDSGRTEDAMAIAADVIQNLEKINFHGNRAGQIVRSMLQHSRTSSGQKELIDINALCDEYLRLSYHGLRAKDKSFNAKFETDFDQTLEKISVIPQDIGRVILNLINNAFYAVSEKKKLNPKNYDPTVLVTTKKMGGNVCISIKDNGTGIPQKALDKIFQPFFTTKPTGQGTGLGLSLSYDIVTKGHGGELKVETTEGEGTEFIIQVPC